MSHPSASNGAQTEAAYSERLASFVAVCRELVRRGQPYQAVALCHELMRFLYPVEPCAGFVHTDPATFLVRHIGSLVDTARAMLDAVAGYEGVLISWTADSPSAGPGWGLEARTSDLYSNLWTRFDRSTLCEESRALLQRRLPEAVMTEHVKGRSVLDLGCGSGRYAIALAAVGARQVTAVDVQEKSFEAARELCRKQGLPVVFDTVDVLDLPFEDRSFDFVFCNGVLHHTRDWKAGVAEYCRVMKRSGYLYLYGSGGFFWNTRRALREVFADIPAAYAQAVLDIMGMPANRFIFMDIWYVPVEEHLRGADLEPALASHGVMVERLASDVPSDLNHPTVRTLPDADLVWGEGEHRLLVTRSPDGKPR